MSIDDRMRAAASELRLASERTRPTTLPVTIRRPAKRLKVAAALAAAAVLVTVGTVLVLQSHGRPVKLRTAEGPDGSLSLTWQRLAAAPGTFPGQTMITSTATWRGSVYAVGSVPRPACHFGDTSLACASPEPAEWVLRPKGRWTRLPPSSTPQVAHPDDSRLVATPTQLLLIDEGPAGAGWWTAPPPYENLTQVWASSTGLSWRQENIPSAMRLSALGPAVYGHDDVVAVASDVITHEQGVWVFRQGRWAFHQTTGTDHAGVFAWSMTATPSGFLAGGQVTTGTTQEPAVWTSGDGVHWRETVLSRAGGSVNAVLDRDGTLVAAGSSGPGGTAGYWRASGRTWIADPVSGDPPVPQSLALIGGHVLALSRNGVVSAYSPQGWVTVPGLGEPPSDDVLSVGSSAVLSGRLVGFMEPPLEKGMAVAPPLQPWSFTVRNT